MIYQIPVWKLENFYLGTHRSKKHVLFGAQKEKMLFVMEHPLTCTSNLIYMSAGKKSQIFKWNWIILIHSSFIAFLVIGAPCSSAEETEGRGIWGYGGCHHMHAHKHPKIYM